MAPRATESDLENAHIEIETGSRAGEVIPVTFNPTEYSLEKSVTYGEQKLPGLTTPVTQFVSGETETLSMELFFDTYEEGLDVRREYTDGIDSLLAVDGQLHAPPVCRFVWGRGLDFTCVLQSASKKFTMFLPDGRPVRARVTVTFRHYERPDRERAEEPRESGDRTKVWRVTDGDTLWSIAAAEYGDPGTWRPIADENGIEDPTTLEPGRELVLPPLEV